MSITFSLSPSCLGDLNAGAPSESRRLTQNYRIDAPMKSWHKFTRRLHHSRVSGAYPANTPSNGLLDDA